MLRAGVEGLHRRRRAGRAARRRRRWRSPCSPATTPHRPTSCPTGSGSPSRAAAVAWCWPPRTCRPPGSWRRGSSGSCRASAWPADARHDQARAATPAGGRRQRRRPAGHRPRGHQGRRPAGGRGGRRRGDLDRWPRAPAAADGGPANGPPRRGPLGPCGRRRVRRDAVEPAAPRWPRCSTAAATRLRGRGAAALGARVAARGPQGRHPSPAGRARPRDGAIAARRARRAGSAASCWRDVRRRRWRSTVSAAAPDAGPLPAGTVVVVISGPGRRRQGHAGGRAAAPRPAAVAQPVVDDPGAAGPASRPTPTTSSPARRFEQRIAEGGFLEWVEFLDYLQGSPLPEPPAGRDVLFEIDVRGRGATSRSCTPRPCSCSSTPPTGRCRRSACAAGATTRSGSRQRLAKADEEVALAAELDVRAPWSTTTSTVAAAARRS